MRWGVGWVRVHTIPGGVRGLMYNAHMVHSFAQSGWRPTYEVAGAERGWALAMEGMRFRRCTAEGGFRKWKEILVCREMEHLWGKNGLTIVLHKV